MISVDSGRRQTRLDLWSHQANGNKRTDDEIPTLKTAYRRDSENRFEALVYGGAVILGKEMGSK